MRCLSNLHPAGPTPGGAFFPSDIWPSTLASSAEKVVQQDRHFRENDDDPADLRYLRDSPFFKLIHIQYIYIYVINTLCVYHTLYYVYIYICRHYLNMLRICYPKKWMIQAAKMWKKPMIQPWNRAIHGHPRKMWIEMGRSSNEIGAKWRVFLGNVMIQKLKKAQKVVPHSMKH